MSQLVNYVQPVRFKSFDVSSRRNHSYEISSFTETVALKLLTDDPVGFVKYNQRQMSRIYPKGARVESSNYMPQMFWNAGSQFVALNFQVLDLPMQLNMAKFELNGSCGYLPKPLLMRSKDKIFDPFAERIDGVVAKQLNIKILSGQFLSSSKLSTYVEVDMFGLPTDTYRKRFRTKTVESNALNPQYNSPLYQFERIILPDLALLRIAVMDSSGNMIGQRFFPVEKIKPGYRYITLHNEGNQAMMMQSLFIYAEIQDYVSKDDQDMINMLVNPIQAMAEKARKEEEFRSRINAMKNLLDPDEMEQIGMGNLDDVENDHPLMNGGAASASTRGARNGGANNVTNGAEQGRKPPSGAASGGGNHRPGANRAAVNPVTKHQPSSKPSLDTQVDKYEPQTLTDQKLGKNYLKLLKEHDKSVKSHREKEKENFAKFYFQLYPNERPVSTVAKFFGFKPTVNTEMAELNEEVKEKKLLDFLSRHLEHDKDWQMNQIDHIMTKFHQIVTNHQKWELSNLASICQKEETEVQRRKDKEKEELFHNIPVNLDKTETDKKRSEITQNHINSCVEERLILTTKQTERKKVVEEKQNEIKSSLDEESRTRSDEVESQTDADLRNLADLLKKKISEVRSKTTRTSTSSEP